VVLASFRARSYDLVYNPQVSLPPSYRMKSREVCAKGFTSGDLWENGNVRASWHSKCSMGLMSSVPLTQERRFNEL